MSTTLQIELKPVAGDLLVTANNAGTVWLSEFTVDGKTRTIADSWSFRRKRALFHRKDKGTRSVDAPDFTRGKMFKAEWAPFLVAKYLPELAGRRLFIGHYGIKFAGLVGDGTEPKPQSRKMTVLPEDEQTVTPGTVLVASWGYDQTNIDYFVVLRRKGAWAWVQACGAKNVTQTLAMQGTCEPAPTQTIGPVMRRKVHVWEGKEHGCQIDQVRWASVHRGGSDSWTAYA